MEAPGLTREEAMRIAERAVFHARRLAPKLSGESARRFQPVAMENWFGVAWLDAHVWFQEVGIRPFTMKHLEGKIIPMWIDDADGELRKKDPKADTRTTADGRTQVLIFRRAAKRGQRKVELRRRGGEWVKADVPASFPGAPGRIAFRKPTGQIAAGNIGVRWRHPGMDPKGFLYEGMVLAAVEVGLQVREVIATNERWL